MIKVIRKVVRIIKVFLFITLLTMLMVYMGRVASFIYVCEVKSFQHTLTEQRETSGGIEQTAITDRIITKNKDIAKHKVLASLPIVKYFYIDELRELELIK